MMENEGANTLIELRSRNRGFPTTSAAGGGGWAPREDEKVFIEHVVQPTDSLYKIGLQYSVAVSEIKRVNNIGTEQEIHAVKQLRIPVSRLRQHFLNEKNAAAAAASSSGGAALIDVNSPSATPLVGVSEKTALLGDSSEDEERSDGSAKSAIDALFDKTDATVAQARNQLPSPTLEGGAFHFVDASAPDSAAKGTWLLIIGVVLMFVVVPLVLTMLEEHSEAEHEIHHHQNHHLS